MIKAGKGNAHTYPIGWNISLPAQLLTVLTAYHFYSVILAWNEEIGKRRRKMHRISKKQEFIMYYDIKINVLCVFIQVVNKIMLIIG